MIRWEILDRNTDRERAVATDDTAVTEYYVDAYDNTNIGWAYLTTAYGRTEGGAEDSGWWIGDDSMPEHVDEWCEATEQHIRELRHKAEQARQDDNA